MEVSWGTRKLASLGPRVLWAHTVSNLRLPTHFCKEILRSRDWQAPKATSFEHNDFDIIGGNEGRGMKGSPTPGQCHTTPHIYMNTIKGHPHREDTGWQSPCVNSPASFRSTPIQRGDTAPPVTRSPCGEPLAGHPECTCRGLGGSSGDPASCLSYPRRQFHRW